jgi:hypothetical protein
VSVRLIVSQRLCITDFTPAISTSFDTNPLKNHTPFKTPEKMLTAITMKSLLFLLVLSLPLFFVEATPTPKIPTKVSCASKASFGGVPRRAFTTRCGAVLVADSQEELEAILINANGALVVVDHWARYVKGM